MLECDELLEPWQYCSAVQLRALMALTRLLLDELASDDELMLL